jgi:hypothetical protein
MNYQKKVEKRFLKKIEKNKKIKKLIELIFRIKIFWSSSEYKSQLLALKNSVEL